jgi:hypothetical protein
LSLAACGAWYRKGGQEDVGDQPVGDQQPRLRELNVTDDRGDEPESESEEKDPTADRTEPILRGEDPTHRADVAGARDHSGEHSLSDRHGSEHRSDVQELPSSYPQAPFEVGDSLKTVRPTTAPRSS